MTLGKLLLARFSDTHVQIAKLVSNLTPEAVSTPVFSGANPIHWTVGHIVVARTNMLALLGQPSIWSWATIKWFIPGSQPTVTTLDVITFATLRHDLDRTQEQLAAALVSTTDAALGNEHDGRSIADHLLKYANHEAYHTGQLSILVPLSTYNT
jgi:uncharacterized damage-inducible protein DinB